MSNNIYHTAAERLDSLTKTPDHAYKNKTEYPKNNKYWQLIEKELNAYVGTREQHKLFETEINTKYKNQLKEDKEKYNEISAQLLAQFKQDLEEVNGLTNHPKADMLFNKAWEMDHSDGYYQVYMTYNDLADLLD